MAVDFAIADYFYPIELLRRRGKAERAQWWTPARLAEDQAMRLNTMVAHAYREVPYYRRLLDEACVAPADIRTVDDLKKLPTLDKEMVRRHFNALTARNSHRYRPRVVRTSGSSGAPVEIHHDKTSRALEFVYYWRHWSSLGYTLGTTFAELSSVYFLNTSGRARELFHFEPLTRRLLLNSLMLSESATRAWAAAFARYRPRYLKGLASALHALAELWGRVAPPFSLRGVFSNGDTLLAAHRRRIASAFGCQVLDSYGHMERTFAVSECPSGGYHVNSDYGVLELVPLDQPPRITGSGTTRVCRAIGTSLHNLAMPLIRYEVGDVIEVDEAPSPCPCGRGFPLIRSIGGRVNDLIETPDGRLISSLFIVFEMVDHITDGQIVQTDDDRCEVKVVRAADYTADDEAKLRRLLQTMLGSQMAIDVEYVDAIQAAASGKTRRVMSQVPHRTLVLDR